jgi:hypothetical protein
MTLQEEVKISVKDGKLSCAAAFKLAGEHHVPAEEIGDLADTLGIRISHCQLGLFGYGPKAEGKHKIVKPAEQVAPELQEVLERRAIDGKVTCADAWAVADTLGITRMQVSAAMETLGMHVTMCQLHCF